MYQYFKDNALKLAPQIVRWRRQLHMNPEPAFAEKETSFYLAQTLKEMGVEVETGVAKTGIIGFIPAKGSPMRTVALRADMDALPVQEKTGFSFASKKEGFMHACGHDAHMAMVLGAASLWKEVKQPPGNLLLIFQPAEEKPPGGAKEIIAEGILRKYKPEGIFAFHVNPFLQTGKVGVREGVLTAAADRFSLTVIGKGGHGASPHQCIDPVVIASNIIQGWQQVVSRLADPLDPLVVTVGSINGGSEFNIIPEKVELKGTIRTLNKELRSLVPSQMEAVAKGFTGAYGARFEMDYVEGYPSLNNNPEMTRVLARAASDICGEDNVLQLERPLMGGEDMAFFLEEIPGSYAMLGVGPEKGEIFPWHSPLFNLDERALPLGTATLAWASYLHLQKS